MSELIVDENGNCKMRFKQYPKERAHDIANAIILSEMFDEEMKDQMTCCWCKNACKKMIYCYKCKGCGEKFMDSKQMNNFKAYREDFPEERKAEVTYKYYLPDNESDLKMHQNAYRYFSALHDIYDECRRVYKYGDDDYSEETMDFAEKIAGMADDGGIWELE